MTASAADTIVAHYVRLYPTEADEVRQLARIAEWEALQTHDGVRPLARHIRSKVSWGIRNGLRHWLQTQKACKPRVVEYYSTTTDQVEETP